MEVIMNTHGRSSTRFGQLTFVGVPTTLKEIEEHMFGTSVDIKISCINTKDSGKNCRKLGWQLEESSLDSRITEMALLHAHLMVGKAGV